MFHFPTLDIHIVPVMILFRNKVLLTTDIAVFDSDNPVVYIMQKNWRYGENDNLYIEHKYKKKKYGENK